jgi:hypothetical protein
MDTLVPTRTRTFTLAVRASLSERRIGAILLPRLTKGVFPHGQEEEGQEEQGQEEEEVAGSACGPRPGAEECLLGDRVASRAESELARRRCATRRPGVQCCDENQSMKA